MPVVVKDYSFSETLRWATVVLPLCGIMPAKVDVYCSDVYIKLNFPPYFFELDLQSAINDETSTCTLEGNIATFRLEKVSEALWGSADYTFPNSETSGSETDCESHVRKRRQESMQRLLAKEEVQRLAKRRQIEEKDRYLVQQQIQVEREAREKLEKLKEDEKMAALAQVHEWTPSPSSENPLGSQPTETKISPKVGSSSKVDSRVDASSSESWPRSHDIFDAKDAIASPQNTSAHLLDTENEEEEDDPEIAALEAQLRQSLIQKKAARSLPPPRSSTVVQIQVQFTQRKMPTAARESKDHQYEEFLAKKQAEESKRRMLLENTNEKSVVSGKEVPIEETPTFLKPKADSFFRSGDFEAAVNAYTRILEQDPTNMIVLGNRSASGLAWASSLPLTDGRQSVLHETILKDVTSALTHLQDEEILMRDSGLVDFPFDLQKLRAKLHLRKGTVLFRQGHAKSAIESYQNALALSGKVFDVAERSRVQSDLEKMEAHANVAA